MFFLFKLIVFYGGIFVCFVIGLALIIFRPPRLHIRAIYNKETKKIRCTFSVSRAFSPVWIHRIWIPFIGPRFPDDYAQREIEVWEGRLDVPKGQTVELILPANPGAVPGVTLCFGFQYYGVKKVGLISSVANAVIENGDAS